MRVQLLDEATADLADGYRFYERQAEGLGDYFLDSMWSDIQSLRLSGGVHAICFGYHRLLSRRFPYAVCTTALRKELPAYEPFSIAAVIQNG